MCDETSCFKFTVINISIHYNGKFYRNQHLIHVDRKTSHSHCWISQLHRIQDIEQGEGHLFIQPSLCQLFKKSNADKTIPTINQFPSKADQMVILKKNSDVAR